MVAWQVDGREPAEPAGAVPVVLPAAARAAPRRAPRARRRGAARARARLALATTTGQRDNWKYITTLLTQPVTTYKEQVLKHADIRRNYHEINASDQGTE